MRKVLYFCARCFARRGGRTLTHGWWGAKCHDCKAESNSIDGGGAKWSDKLDT